MSLLLFHLGRVGVIYKLSSPCPASKHVALRFYRPPGKCADAMNIALAEQKAKPLDLLCDEDSEFPRKL